MRTLRTGIVIGLLFAVVTTGVGTARTANLSMTTPAKLGTYSSTISASVLAPSFCANRAGLTAVVVSPASGNVSGSGANDLMLGRPHTSNYTLNGGNGADCVVGGLGTGGRETLRGGGGSNDYCIGNGGTQTFNADCDGHTSP